MITVFKGDLMPIGIVSSLMYDALNRAPRRLAFAGWAGAGKTEVCKLIAGTSDFLDGSDFMSHPPVPIFNHADGIKEEVLEWVARARTRALIPGDPSTFVSFCDFLGLSPGMVETHMWPLLGPVWEAMNKLLEDAYDHLPDLAAWDAIPSGQDVDAKVAFVDAYKSLFRTSLQRYGQVIKDLTADPTYWVERTVTRGVEVPICVNGDTRFHEERDLLTYTGWTVYWLDITRETQRRRRPDLTAEQLAHASENGLSRADFADEFVLDSNKPLADVGRQLLERLAGPVLVG